MEYLTSTDNFKVGDYVWISGIGFHSSGRIKYCRRPKRIRIDKVDSNSITVDTDFQGPYIFFLKNSLPSYLTRTDYTSKENMIDYCISKTQIESIDKFNLMIKESINWRYESFKEFESKVLGYLL